MHFKLKTFLNALATFSNVDTKHWDSGKRELELNTKNGALHEHSRKWTGDKLIISWYKSSQKNCTYSSKLYFQYIAKAFLRTLSEKKKKRSVIQNSFVENRRRRVHRSSFWYSCNCIIPLHVSFSIVTYVLFTKN